MGWVERLNQLDERFLAWARTPRGFVGLAVIAVVGAAGLGVYGWVFVDPDWGIAWAVSIVATFLLGWRRRRRRVSPKPARSN